MKAHAQSSEPRPVVIFDLWGTLTDHNSNRALAMMPFLLRRLIEEGWRTVVTTSFGSSEAKTMLSQGQFPNDLRVLSGQDRAKLVGLAVQGIGCDRAYYFDDNPKGLNQVQQLGIPALQGRIFGFTGSRKYSQLAANCKDHRIPLALSPRDIEGILCGGDIFQELCYSQYGQSPNADDLAFLLPGMTIPCSVFCNTADRAITPLLLSHTGPWNSIWLNLGWIGVADDIWALMVGSAAKASRLLDPAERAEVVWKSVEKVSNLPAREKRVLHGQLRLIMKFVEEGIASVGTEAEDCRPEGDLDFFKCDKDRIQKVWFWFEQLGKESC